jgi:hypothetical protein
MTPFEPLFAIDSETIKAVMVLAFLLISGLAKLFSAMKGQQKPGMPKRPAPNLQPAPVPQKPRNDPLASEVDEFLRRAADRSRSKGTRRAAEAMKSDAKPAAKPLAAKVVKERAVGGQVTAHVNQYLDEQEFKRRTEQLGSEVAHIDTEIEQHLHKTFDHTIGNLAGVRGEAAVAPVAIESSEFAAADLAVADTGIYTLLSDPDSIRDAIILNEILRRPEERWA